MGRELTQSSRPIITRKFKDSVKTRAHWRKMSLDHRMNIGQMLPTLMPTEKIWFGVDGKFTSEREGSEFVVTVKTDLAASAVVDGDEVLNVQGHVSRKFCQNRLQNKHKSMLAV